MADPALRGTGAAAGPAGLFGRQYSRLCDDDADHAALALADPRRGRAGHRRSADRVAADHSHLPRIRVAGGQPAVGLRDRRAFAGPRRLDRLSVRFRRDPGGAAAKQERGRTHRAGAQSRQQSRLRDAGRRRFGAPSDRDEHGARRTEGDDSGGRAADQVQLRRDLAPARRPRGERHRGQLHQLGPAAALRSLGLRPQLPRAADRQDAQRSRTFGALARLLCPGPGHHRHRRRERRQAARRRRELAPGRIAGRPQQGARRRDGAPDGGRRRISAGARDRPDERRDGQHPAASPGAGQASGGLSAEADVHEARASRDGKPQGAD